MQLGMFLRRDLVIAARRGSIFWDRAIVAAVATAMATAVVVSWDWWEWDRLTVSGAAGFALATFAVVAGVQAVSALGVVAVAVAPGIARERDKKTLDALLATRLSSAEIVLGTLAAGLLKSMTGLLAALPVIALVVFLGGVDLRLALLAYAGLASTCFAVGALSVAVSAGARTAQRSASTATGLVMAWMVLPFSLVIVLPRHWPAGARWVAPVALWIVDSSPIGVIMNLVGMIRRASLVGAVLRMIGLQVAAGVLLILWAIRRLRPASRALYDWEGRAALLRSLRRRWRRRPACGDDPVLWHEIHSSRGASEALLLSGLLLCVLLIGLMVYVTSWFAGPAFAELAERGYGAAPGNLTIPEINPFARAVLVKFEKQSMDLAPGLARLEFNIALRQASGVIAFFYVLVVAGAASESVVGEKERDTWLGLLATPLTGREILRAKMIGAAWRTRGLFLVLAGLWTVGLLAGALHPLGFLAALAGLSVTTWFFAAYYTYASLWSRDREQANSRVLVPSMLLTMSALVLPFLPSGFASVLMGVGSPPFLTWASLLSYEDVLAATRSGEYPQLAAVHITTGEGAGMVLATVLIGLTGQALAAALLTRAAYRGFDAAVGRPIRPRVTPTPLDHGVALHETVAMT